VRLNSPAALPLLVEQYSFFAFELQFANLIILIVFDNYELNLYQQVSFVEPTYFLIDDLFSK